MTMENAAEKPPTWSLYAWEKTGWVQLNQDFYTEEDAETALDQARFKAEFASEADFQHFIIVPENDPDFVFPDDPTK